MALRELIATFGFGVDTSALGAADTAVGSISDSLLNMGKGVAAAFAVDAIFSFGRETLQIADSLAKQAGALGVSTEQLQGWQHAASLSGSSAEEFTAALTKFTRNVNESGEAAAGPAAKAFKELGVSIKDELTGKLGQPIDLLDGVVAGLENIQDPAKRTALVMDLFGKSGARLLPLFSEGTEGLAKLRAEVKELGFGFDEAFLENAQEVNDNVDRLKLGMRGLMVQVLGPILPDIVELSKGAINVAKGLIEWTKHTSITNAGLAAIALKGIPAVVKGLRTLGGFALRTVAPFLALEDAIVWLAGGDSLIGRGLEKALGAGGAEDSRKALLGFFNDVKDVVVNDLAPALTSITESPLFQGVGKAALETVLGVLTLIGIALTDDAKKVDELGDRFLKNTNAIKEAFGFLDAMANIDKETIRKGLNDGLDAVEGFVGGKLGLETRVDRDAKKTYPVDRPQLAPLPGASAFFAPPEVVSGVPAPYKPATTSVDYAAAFRPAVATAPAPASSYVDNSQTTVAPVTHLTVKVEGGGSDEAVGTRIGKAAGKKITEINTRAVQAALVPTPGG